MDELEACQIAVGTYDDLPEMRWLEERLNAAIFDCRVVAQARAELKPDRRQSAILDVVPTALSNAQAIFHLLKLGYLPAAHALCRPLFEATGISNLLMDDDKWVSFWAEGWPQNGRPSLAKLISHISGENPQELDAIRALANEFHLAIHVTQTAAEVNASASPDGAEVHWFGPIPTAKERVANIACAAALCAVVLASNAKQAFLNNAST